MIIENQEILERFWSSNTPNDIIQFLCNETKKINIAPTKYTCGLIITRDVITKEIKTYFGITTITSEGEDIKFILRYGQKLEQDLMTDILKQYFLTTNSKENE